jgi:hypothetical protein
VDRERVPDEWVGQGVVVGLASIEAMGAEVLATLDEIRDDGVSLSRIGELGPGPTMFCPWDSIRQVRPRSELDRMPHDEMPEGAPEGKVWMEELSGVGPEPAPIPEGFRGASARTLQKVVPVVQKAGVGGVTVALASVEVHEGGNGILRFLISSDTEYLGMPEPAIRVRDDSGRSYVVLPDHAGSSGDGVEVSVHALGLPEPAELEVEIARLTEFDYRHDDAEVASWEGPWTFRFSI